MCVCCGAVAGAELVWEAERQGCVWAASIALPAGWRHLTSLWRTKWLAPCLLPQCMRLWAPAGPVAALAPPAWTLGCDGDVPRAHRASLTVLGPLSDEWMWMAAMPPMSSGHAGGRRESTGLLSLRWALASVGLRDCRHPTVACAAAADEGEGPVLPSWPALLWGVPLQPQLCILWGQMCVCPS